MDVLLRVVKYIRCFVHETRRFQTCSFATYRVFNPLLATVNCVHCKRTPITMICFRFRPTDRHWNLGRDRRSRLRTRRIVTLHE